MSRSASQPSAAITSKLQQAVEHHQRGELAQAERLYREILAQAPAHFDALHLLGIVHHQQGRHESAVELIGRALKIDRDNAAAHLNIGTVLRALKRPAEALASFDRAVALKPRYTEALNNRGNALLDLKRPEEALASYDRALALKPDHAEVLNNRGSALRELKRLEEALVSFDRAAALKPDYAEAFNNRGDALMDLKRPQEALVSYDHALALKSDCPDVLNKRGVALQELKRPDEALASYDRALALKLDYADALCNRGNALRDLQRPEEALASYDRALVLEPDHAEALNNRGNALRDLKRPEEALASYDGALALKPDHAEAHNNRGVALQDLKQPQEALASYDHALALRPNHADALCNRGNTLLALKRPEDALASYDRALALKPDHAEALNNRGNALLALKRPEDALASYDRALVLKPDYADALNNRGLALWDARRHEDAARCFVQLLALAPDYDYAIGNVFHSQLHLCNWTEHASTAERVVSAVGKGSRAYYPFPFLAVSPCAAAQLQCARVFAADKYPASAAPFWSGPRYSHDRIRVAYVSADFREHVVSYLTVGLFEKHDRERFETFAISLHPPQQSALGQRVKAAFNRFVDVTRKGDREVAALMRELEVDIAVDLMGFTSNCRTGIFAHRPAPIQVNYLGFPGTIGAKYIDYIIADRFVIPEDQRDRYAEKVVYLPESFQANDDQRKIGEKAPSRLEAGLPESGFVFCSFNNSYKLNPPVFEIWMRLLEAAEGSVLWLVAENLSVQNNLRREAENRGIDANRLIFAPRVPYADHLARLRLADLFLDTLPFNAGATASDALWAGVPVLTRSGEAFAARMAGSLLNAVGLPELVTHSVEEYEALALKLAVHPSTSSLRSYARDERGTLLSELRERLARNHKTCPLFDTDRFRRHIESAYVSMWERYQRGEEPECFAVRPIGGRYAGQ